MKKLLSVIVLVLLFAACGGGGPSQTSSNGNGDGDGGDETPPVPPTKYVDVYNIASVDDIDFDTYVTLDDGSIWEVTFGIHASLWLFGNDVVVCDDVMVNLDRQNGDKVEQVAGPIHGLCDKYYITDKSSDGTEITLNDGSIWTVDSLDTIESSLWLPLDDVVIAKPSLTDEIVNLDEKENVGATRIN